MRIEFACSVHMLIRKRLRTHARTLALAALCAAGLYASTVQADPVPDGGALTTGLGYDANGNLISRP
ncbi:hypothetical protein GCM10009107_61370 [Ideonella azotifigens]|uniref:Uncharacterized protein n=1 Tax=Ideonella azotifigens TaxID=513160 RepID=A0ABN1KKZ5_9BURK